MCTLQSSCSMCGSSSVSFSKVCLFQPEKRGLVSSCGAELAELKPSEGSFLQWSVTWWLASVLSKCRNFIWTLSTLNTICFAQSQKQVSSVNIKKFYLDTFLPVHKVVTDENQSVTNPSNDADCFDDGFHTTLFSCYLIRGLRVQTSLPSCREVTENLESISGAAQVRINPEETWQPDVKKASLFHLYKSYYLKTYVTLYLSFKKTKTPPTVPSPLDSHRREACVDS